MHSCIKVHFFGIAAPWLSSLLPLYVTAVRNSCYSRRQGLLRLVAVVTIPHEDRPTGFAYANTTVSPRRTAARWWHFAMRSFRLIAGDANRRADPHTSAPRKPLAPAVLKEKKRPGCASAQACFFRMGVCPAANPGLSLLPTNHRPVKTPCMQTGSCDLRRSRAPERSRVCRPDVGRRATGTTRAEPRRRRRRPRRIRPSPLDAVRGMT